MNLDSLLIDKRFPLHWQMSRTERLVMIGLLEELRPRLSLEVGTYHGGSLQVIAHYSERVIAIDSNPQVAADFPNVTYRVGESQEVLPRLMGEFQETPQFILIDAGHSADAVRADINAILKMRPTSDAVMLMHDSFNENVRRGIREASWADSPFVHEVEIDFVPGNHVASDFDTANAGELWGGFACAILKSSPRTSDLVVREWQRTMFETMRSMSDKPSLLGRLFS